jgi:malonyl-CoA/methylmalonyl-CoA synthetase
MASVAKPKSGSARGYPLAVNPVRPRHLRVGTDEDPSRTLGGSSLPEVWKARWSERPSAPTLRFASGGGGWKSAGALEAHSHAAALRLAAGGVRRGDRVLWSMATSERSIVACVAILRLGAVLVPMNPALTEREFAYIVADTMPRAGVLDNPERVPWLQRASGGSSTALDSQCNEVGGTGAGPPNHSGSDIALDGAAPEDPALIVYTSGTTGTPKGAVLTHSNLVAGISSLRIAWDWTDQDRLVLALPLFHVHGLCVGLFATLGIGAGAIVHEQFNADNVLHSIQEHDASLFFGVPTMYHRILTSSSHRSLGRLRLCVSGSAPLPPSQWETLRDRCGVEILERYGTTETLLVVSNPLVGERRPGSIGFPLPQSEVGLGQPSEWSDEGELWVRGPTVFSGYWNRPATRAECFEEDWFRTGDIAERDGDGYLSIKGRIKELIISGGFNVYPAEVEDVLLAHPDVLEVAVAGAPSEEWGEAVCAWVVTGSSAMKGEELLAFAARRLAPYKRPRVIHFVDALPRNALGKVVRGELR